MFNVFRLKLNVSLSYSIHIVSYYILLLGRYILQLKLNSSLCKCFFPGVAPSSNDAYLSFVHWRQQLSKNHWVFKALCIRWGILSVVNGMGYFFILVPGCAVATITCTCMSRTFCGFYLRFWIWQNVCSTVKHFCRNMRIFSLHIRIAFTGVFQNGHTWLKGTLRNACD